ncbi:MAG: DinB family protein [Anaerolineales bacterium]|nr:DinB family protein [Anaerolineales bacterium]
MVDLKSFRQKWSADQKRLRELYTAGNQLEETQNLFSSQHAVLHSRTMTGQGDWSFADLVFGDIDDELFRKVPDQTDHSLIWILWHISRIEDVTLNVLVAGGSQIYLRDGWKEKLSSPIHHVGNLIDTEDLAAISQALDPDLLFSYRDAVGRQTQIIAAGLEEDFLAQKVPPERLTRLLEEGAVLPQAEGLLAYWRKRRIFEMLLMPPTRHLMTHLNEAYSLRKILEKPQ